jgi:hypothetical protein
MPERFIDRILTGFARECLPAQNISPAKAQRRKALPRSGAFRCAVAPLREKYFFTTIVSGYQRPKICINSVSQLNGSSRGLPRTVQ